MTLRTVFLDRATLKARVRPPACTTDYVEYDQTTPEQIVTRLQGAVVAITNKVPLRAPTLAQLPHLKMIAVAATGYDNIDLPWCRAHGVAVANIRNYAVHAVPEHVFALILALRRNLLAYHQDVAAGLWERSTQFCLANHAIGDLYGSTLGLIGHGVLGQGTARIAENGFGMRVLFAQHGQSQAPEGRTLVPLEQLLAQSDVVSLHCPLTAQTRHLIGLAQLQSMRPHALLINTARGGLVDEQALVQALEQGLIAGAGFDVLGTEPPPPEHPLATLRRPNFILTPHVAWASEQAMQALADQLMANIEAWHQGKPQHLLT